MGVRGWIANTRWFVVHRILHAADSPHRIALGAAIGMWVALLPLVGIQMVVSATLCIPVRGNKAIAAAMAWVSNPITIIPIFLPCYWLGCLLLGLDAIPTSEFEAIFNPGVDTGWWDSVSASWSAMMAVVAPLWLGSGIVATIVAIPTYFVTIRLVTQYRIRRFGRADFTDDNPTLSEE